MLSRVEPVFIEDEQANSRPAEQNEYLVYRYDLEQVIELNGHIQILELCVARIYCGNKQNQ